MVLYKRRPVAYAPPPDGLGDNAEVFLMKGTSEVFTDYEKYLKRYDWLNRRKFTDAVNGKTGLNFWEALESETKSSASIDNVFPEVLREPILRKVQFSTMSRMDDLVNMVFDEFQNEFFPGEEIFAILDDGEQSKALIREKAKFPMIRAADGTIQREPFSRYFVTLLPPKKDDALVDDKHLRRDRKVFTKANLRSFLKSSLQREGWVGAPWLVKEALAIHYRLPMEIPAHLLQDAKLLAHKQLAQVREPKAKKPKMSHTTETNGLDTSGPPGKKLKNRVPHGHSNGNAKARAPSPPPPPPLPKYPIEDLDVPPRRDGVHRPELKFWTEELADFVKSKDREGFQFKGLTMKSMGMLLEIWNTLNVQAEVYVLDSFTFDDFVEAMNYVSNDTPCELFEEIHCAVLKLFLNAEGKIAVRDMPKRPQEPSDDEDEEQDESEPSTPEPVVEDVPARSTRSRRSLLETSNDIAASLVEDDKRVHRAAEMLGDSTWEERLQARDFEDGGWQVIVIGLLHHLTHSDFYRDECEKILYELAPEDEEPTRETARRLYTHLDVNLKISALQMLTLLTIRSEAIKEFLETCADDMTDVRKRKMEYQRERKGIVDQLAAKEKERRALQQEHNLSDEGYKLDDAEVAAALATLKAEAEGDTTMDVTEDSSEINGHALHDSSDEGVPGRALRRGNDRKRKRENDAVKRDKIRAEKALLAKAQTKHTKEFRKLQSESDALKKKILELEAQIDDCDHDLREANVQRTRVLGKDRFCNRYYWFERNGQPFAGLPSSSTAHYGYANARVWVQGPDALEYEGFIARDEREQELYRQEFSLTVPERRALEEGPTMLRDAGEWGYIDSPAVLEQLMNWLDDRGDREKKLKKELQEWQNKITEYMRVLQEFREKEELRLLEAQEELEGLLGGGRGGGRITTRGKVHDGLREVQPLCLKWTNSMAIENLGHLHSRPKPARGGRGPGRKGKKADGGAAAGPPAKGVAVVLGRTGSVKSQRGGRGK